MTIKRAVLLSALEKCLPGVSTGSALIPGADTFVFTGNRVYSYNEAVAVSVAFPLEDEAEKFVVALKAAELVKLLTKLEDDDLTLVVSENRWNLKSGSARAELHGMESNTLKYIMELHNSLQKAEWKPVAARFFEGAKLCTIPGTRYMYAGMAARGAAIMTTDGAQLLHYVTDSVMAEDIWLSEAEAAELRKFADLTEYTIVQPWIHFRTATAIVVSFHLQDSVKFPFDGIQKLVAAAIHVDEGDIVGTLPEALRKAVSRASAFSEEISSAPDREAVELTIATDHVLIHAERLSGRYTEKLPLEGYALTLPGPITVLIDARILQAALQRSRSFRVKLRTLKEGEEVREPYQLVFCSDSFTHVVALMKRP